MLAGNGYPANETVIEASEDFVGLSGYAEGMDIPVIAVFKEGDCVRKRFTIAHELAHLLFDFSDCENNDHEKLCHAFAGALLLPEKVIREEFGGERKKLTEWELKKLKGIYGISMQAIMARALILGLVSENTYKTFQIYVSKNGWRKDEPGQYSGIEKANRFKQLVLHAAAEQIISYSKGAEFLNLSLADFRTGGSCRFMIFLVNDANILIDLLKIDLLDTFFQLEFDFQVTDMVFAEIQEDNVAELHRFIDRQLLTKQGFSFEELLKIQLIEVNNPALSIADCSCLYLAEKLSGTLLTGDGALRRIAEQHNIPVHGILWVQTGTVGDGKDRIVTFYQLNL